MERTDIRYALTEVAEDKDLLNRCNEDQKKYSLLRRTWRLVLAMKRITIIGETGRNLSTRLTEHKRATRNGDVNNHIAEHHLRCFDTVFQTPYRYFSIALKVIFSLSDRCKIFTSNWLWIEICQNVGFRKIDNTMTTINKKL